MNSIDVSDLETYEDRFLNPEDDYERFEPFAEGMMFAQQELLEHLKSLKNDKPAIAKDAAQMALEFLVGDDFKDYDLNHLCAMEIKTSTDMTIIPPNGMDRIERDNILTWLFNAANS